ncbi:MAG: type II toxin-antitoxin system RelE/ParE family toxin [Betaproteobacteria bacterium]|nr:type II toxin-antitoxin system RelE/ParE family toxin [Betaproteobacteria bacterium]
MIRNFRHKGMERSFRHDDSRGINPRQAPRIRRMLDLIDQTTDVAQLDVPGMHLHPLKGERKGEWAMTVSGNWRITFRFVGEDATDLNLEDYH